MQSDYAGVLDYIVLFPRIINIITKERKPECKGISMMYEEHFSILNTYWKPLQPNYAIFHIISFRIHQCSSSDDNVT